MKSPEVQTRTDPLWTARRALGIDLDRARTQVTALRSHLAARDVQAVRSSFTELRSILSRHMAWESGTLDDQPGWRPPGGREFHEWSLTTWHDALNRALKEIARLVGAPSLAIPSVCWALEAAVGRLEEVLESYAHRIDETYYHDLDIRIRSMSDTDAGRMQRAWRDDTAVAPGGQT